MTASDNRRALSRAQVREVDRRAIEDYGVPGIVLMENAGRHAAEFIRDALASGGRRVAVVCGRGNNGGDGFVVARHLLNDGFEVELFLACDSSLLAGDAAVNWRIAQAMKLPAVPFDTAEHIANAAARLRAYDAVVDALLGTGFQGDVRPPLDKAIAAINDSGARIFALDLPSGLDCDTGRPSNATVRAESTITFVARKAGFDAPGASAFTGRVHVADIGAPIGIVQAILREAPF